MKTRSAELEKIAEAYHLNENVPDKFIEDICQEHCCNWLGTLIERSDQVIELGYGEGITAARLSPLAENYTVVEGAESLVQVMRSRHPNLHIVYALFEEYVPPQPCDVLLALHVFEHVDDPVELGKMLRKWLKDDGEMVVIVPNSHSIHRRLAVLMGIQPALDTLSPRDHLVGHQRVYDMASLVSDLSAAGFEVIERKGFFLKTLPNGMMLNHIPELIWALNKIGDELPAEWQANLALRLRKRS